METPLEYLELIAENTNDLIAITDIEGNYIYVSPSHRSLGYDPEKLIGTPGALLMHPEDLETLMLELEMALVETKKKTSRTVRYRFKDSEGEWHVLEATVTLIKGIKKKPDLLVFISRDISERKKIEDALKENEEKYRLLAENAIEVIWIMDLFGNFTYISPSVMHLRGYTPEEAIAMPLEETMTMDSYVYAMEELSKEIAKSADERSHSRILEFEQICKDGSTVWTEATIRMVNDENGELVAIQGTTRDITVRKEAQETLKISEERFRLFYEQAPLACQSLDAQGKILDVNKAWLELFGYDKKEVIEKDFVDILSPGFSERFKRNLDHLMEKGEILNTELDIQRKDGAKVTVSMNGKTAMDSENNFIQSHLILFDITERKHNEREMRRRTMKYELTEGNIYLIQEPSSSLSREVFKDLLNAGYFGIAFTRSPGFSLSRSLSEHLSVYWMGDTKGEDILSPKPSAVMKKIEELSNGQAVLIERLDYIISKNNFKHVLSLIQNLSESAFLQRHIIIISIDPATLDKKGLALLEKETQKISSAVHKLPDDLQQILRFVYEQNIVSVKPTFTEVKNYFELSKPTVRKRLNALHTAGYVFETKKGRKKILELTEKGFLVFR